MTRDFRVKDERGSWLREIEGKESLTRGVF